jgi:hypothetical protein
MKILFAGNSQVSCLINAYVKNRDVLIGGAVPSFYCVPGGWGPNLSVRDGAIVLAPNAIDNRYPPYVFPSEARDFKVNDYDVVVISALGMIGLGYQSGYDLATFGQLYGFGRGSGVGVNVPITESYFRDAIDCEVRLQGGVKFLYELRNSFPNKIIVQMFPLVSDALLDQPEWQINKLYSDVRGFVRFTNGVTYAVMKKITDECGATLLNCPNEDWVKAGFTPREYFDGEDGVHPNEKYARLVFGQLNSFI